MTRIRLAVLALAMSAPTAALAADAPVARATIVGLEKQHNVDLGGGVLALRLSARVDTESLVGRKLTLVAFFHDVAGLAIPSAMPSYADASGQVRVASQDTAVTKSPESLDFALTVPYGAFPRRPGGKYQV